MKHSRFARSFGLVRISLLVTGITVGTTCVLGATDSREKVIPAVTLKNGTVLREVKVIGVGSTTVMARWAGGQGSIVLTQLPQDLQDALAPVTAPKPVAAPEPTPALMAPANLATAELPTEIKLTNGFVMHRSVVTRWDRDAVLVSYQGGIVLVQFKNIAPGQRAIFEARRSEAMDRQAKLAAAQVVAASEASELGHAQQERGELQAKEAEQKTAAINRGVAEGYLVKGMTKAQVKQAYTGRGNGEVNGNSSLLIYHGQGADKHGNNADRALFFDEKDILTSWSDQRGNELEGAIQRSDLDDGLNGPPR